MILKMYIGKLLVDECELIYKGLESTMDRQNHQELLASDMYWRNYRRIRAIGLVADFYIEGVQSKMNKSDFKVIE
jgi:hypothetical protein